MRCRFALISISLLLTATSAQADPAVGGPYVLNPFTTDGGGGASSGGAFTLTATIGQPDASNVISGGVFQLNGGFWRGGGAAPGGDLIFQNSFE